MTEKNTSIQPRSDAGHATAEDGLVLLEGPDGVAVTMTADAAAKTAESLRAAAVEALTQPPPSPETGEGK